MVNLLHRVLFAATVISVWFLFGCSAAFDIAITGAGSTAKIEKINYFKTTDDFIAGGSGLPDFYYISPNVNLNNYKTIMITNFTSITSDVSKVRSLQMSVFKNLRQDIADNIEQTFDGSVFPKCVRFTDKISHQDKDSIKKLQADAVLFGNISENKTGFHDNKGTLLTTTQVEIKLVDRRTGQEVIKMINRSSTDSDKVSMPIVRILANLVNKAKNTNQETKAMTVASDSDKQEKPIRKLTIINKTKVKAEANANSKVIMTLNAGVIIEKIDESDEWYKVRTKKGKSGWILKSSAEDSE